MSAHPGSWCQRLAALLLCGWATYLMADGPGLTLPALPGSSPGSEPIVREQAASPGQPSWSLWASWQRPEREPLRASGKSEGPFGALTGQEMLRDGDASTVWDDPFWKREWQTDEAWKISIAGPLSAFGKLGASGEQARREETHLAGRAGLACQVPLPVGELVVRSGAGVAYADLLRPERVKERADVLVEAEARWPLIFGLGLEYQGTAAPALSALERDWLSQDMRLAIPVGTAGKLRIGARHRWDITPEPRPLTDGLQLYLGLELKR